MLQTRQFINDIVKVVTDSRTKMLLYADNFKMFRKIYREHDRTKLQSGITSFQGWVERNKMKFQLDKCKVLNCKFF